MPIPLPLPEPYMCIVNMVYEQVVGVTQGETGASWTWFLSRLKSALVRPEGVKKLELAGFEKWSRAYCPAKRCNYMTSNSVESVNSLSRIVRKLPTQKRRSYNKRVTQEHLTREVLMDEERLRNSKIYQDLDDVAQPKPKPSPNEGFEKWSRAYCPAKRCNYMTSNSVESVNSLSRIVRKLPTGQGSHLTVKCGKDLEAHLSTVQECRLLESGGYLDRMTQARKF
nr:transposase, MuDR, MULE transposase domain protein [Tanacetum cinerariifolium]